jgi:hypothetical protein
MFGGSGFNIENPDDELATQRDFKVNCASRSVWNCHPPPQSQKTKALILYLKRAMHPEKSTLFRSECRAVDKRHAFCGNPELKRSSPTKHFLAWSARTNAWQ